MIVIEKQNLGSMSPEEIRAAWSEIFRKEPYKDEIRKLGKLYPDRKSLYVSFNDILRESDIFAHNIILDAEYYIREGEKEILNFLDERSREIIIRDRGKINLRITDLPSNLVQKDIRKLRASHIRKLVRVKGIVKMVSEVKPRIIEAAYRCSACGDITYIKLDEFESLTEPLRCENCDAPRTKVKFTYIEEYSKFIDSQKVFLQENPEDLKGGEQPQKIMCYLEDDVTGEIFPGDRIVINAIVKARREKSSSQEYSLYLKVVSVEKEKTVEEIQLTEDDIKQIESLSRDPHIIDKLKSIIAPVIYGHDIIKEALVLQMFGGIKKNIGETSIRGDIHILLVGDPGTAKTQLLRYMAKLAPRGWYAGGKMSTAAGLTATAVRDEEGKWTLEAGVLVLGDGGYVAIDEIDKIDRDELSALLEAMENQTITVAKAGINVQLNARCSILAAANPKYGKFDTSQPDIVSQIDLDPALLSRFDVIFKIIDTPNEVTDERIADHMLETHRMGEKKRSGKLVGKKIGLEPQIPIDLFRKYVAYARKNVFPEMTDEVKEIIKEEYVKMRKKSQENRTLAITPRQLEAIIRFAEASARARLSNTITVEDAKRAIRIVTFFITDVAGSDVLTIYSGMPTSMREKINYVLSVIRDLAVEFGGAHYDEILKRCERSGIKASEADEIIRRLYNDGRIIEKSRNVYVVV